MVGVFLAFASLAVIMTARVFIIPPMKRFQQQAPDDNPLGS